MSGSEDIGEELLSACRTTIGDELRSLTYFTPDDYEHLYLRDDLERSEESHRFVENERMGFTSHETYEWSELGEYHYTIRIFDEGYVVRVIVGDRGAYATTDALTMERFDEAAEAMREILASH